MFLRKRSLFVSIGQLFSERTCSQVASQSSKPESKIKIQNGPGLSHFLKNNPSKRREKIFPAVVDTHAYISPDQISGEGKKVMLVTFGCQMNVNDMEIVRGLLVQNGYSETTVESEADAILIMTCSIRDGAEEKIWNRLKHLKKSQRRPRTIAVLGCMAERVKSTLLTAPGDLCQVVAGPDSYRDLPRLLALSRSGTKAMNVQLSFEETYADVSPVRVDADSKSAFVSIMRGCDNMCTYCIVPFTRGRERSRPIDSIVDEVRRLRDEGVKQITLLGQNVNSYRDTSESSISLGVDSKMVDGFSTVYGQKSGGRSFATLLDNVSRVDDEMRIRFTSPHPKDFPTEVITLIKERKNICNQIHLPAQSGDDKVLEAMGRGYSRETYLSLVSHIKNVIPDVCLTSDFIAGFCGETEEAHQNTLNLIREVDYSFCFVFPYSMREGTRAHRRLVDDVPEEIKMKRHEELASVFREVTLRRNLSRIGETELVLVEGRSKRSANAVSGRSDGGIVVIIEERDKKIHAGDYVVAKITGGTSQTMIGEYISHSSIREYDNLR
ncbi:hypothetical protein PFISCL1PPCAC_10548 [Pristionchus fissidentatus]|uniref:CDK5RAP1-like protein n=1 Tax=Pristionchus fissidentatus TaxID=1538716 RepID=A0AAV5VKY1_9BILA|nr:hypothetical protein PFISCL1PPCAC_10548 [Pristionchus fissidentatus]